MKKIIFFIIVCLWSDFVTAQQFVVNKSIKIPTFVSQGDVMVYSASDSLIKIIVDTVDHVAAKNLMGVYKDTISLPAVKVISPLTTVSQLNALPTGSYVFLNPDSTFFNKDTAMIIKTVFIHDTVTITKIVTVPLQCPPPAKQRTVTAFPAWDPINKKWIFPYDDATITTL